MDLNEMERAVNEANATLRKADILAGKMLNIVCGRIRKASVSDWTLCEIKRELKKFNMHTKTWED